MEPEKMITDVYEKTGESSVLPKSPSNSFTIDGEEVKIEDTVVFEAFVKEVGEFSYMILTNMATDENYKKLSDEQKQTAIQKAYDYSRRRSRKNLYGSYDMGSNAFKELYEKNASPSAVSKAIVKYAKANK
jgi:hypothetical protein